MIKRSSPLILVCLAALWLLHGEAARQLPFPRLTNGIGDSFTDWISVSDPATIVMTVLRGVALGLAWYLLVVISLQVIASAAGYRSRALDAITPLLVKQAIGLSLAITSVVPVWSLPAGADSGESPPVTMVRVSSVETDAPGTTTPTTTRPPVSQTPDTTDADGMVMTRLGPVDDQQATTPETTRATRWTVTEGEHFWQIAADVLEERLDRSANEAEIDSYWRLLIERNRHRLVDPANPDLLLPGQVLDLPATAQ